MINQKKIVSKIEHIILMMPLHITFSMYLRTGLAVAVQLQAVRVSFF